MKFEIKKRERISELHYPDEEFRIARDFAKKVFDEFGELVRSLVLFGSTAKKNKKLSKEADVDVLIILDDVSINFSRDLVQTYRIVVEKILANMAKGERLHIQSMKLSSWWDYIRAGDPVATNILRYGIALIDTGIFDPLQALLDRGRIRPSREAIHTYYAMAPQSIARSKEKLLGAMVDLYWASIDAAHAALMSLGEIPPSPDHVVDMLEKKLVKKGYLSRKHLAIMKRNYTIFKKITHRELKEVDGKDYDLYKVKTIELVDELRKVIEKVKFRR